MAFWAQKTTPKSIIGGQEGLKEHLFEVGIYFKYKRLRTKIDSIYFLLATFLIIHMQQLQVCVRLKEHFLLFSSGVFCWEIWKWFDTHFVFFIFLNGGHEYIGICFYIIYLIWTIMLGEMFDKIFWI